MCTCDSQKGDLNTEITWNNNWELITASGLVILKRSVCAAEAGWCLDAMFRVFNKTLVYLVNDYDYNDIHVTGSSEYIGEPGYYYTRKVRFSYTGEKCGWIKADDDLSPWIKFDFLHSRVAVAVKIGKRCHDDEGEQYVTSFHVSSSDDDVTWSYIGTDVKPEYVGRLFTWWFGMAVSARYFRIEPVTWKNYAAMQADFLGYM